MPDGILARSIDDLPIAVIDVETTGISPSWDRVIELSVVRVEPVTGARTLVFDSLINPEQSVGATHVHGITDAMVRKAPRFAQVWPDIRAALAGCVVAAYNASFDMNFLRVETEAAGEPVAPPHVCMMYLRPLIGIGERCTLAEACRAHGVAIGDAHRAAADAMATAAMVPAYLQAMRSRRIATYEDLSRAGSHKYLGSFRYHPLDHRPAPSAGAVFPREAAAAARRPRR
jgi:DNA polymerase-3 subunit epsilon